MTKILKTIIDENNGLEVYVVEGVDSGFRVSIKDIESNAFLPFSYGCDTYDAAVIKALSMLWILG